MRDKLHTYHTKRNFGVTPEPEGHVASRSEHPRFVVQKHAASTLHYDFRLEMDGTLKSWAIPKGPSLDPAQKRLAVEVEDHPLDYIDFQGEIPAHQYGAGHVEVWDNGYWEGPDDPAAAYAAGKIKFRLEGEKLHGGWNLVRTRRQESTGKQQWLLIKERDDYARPAAEYDITQALPDSVKPEGKRKPAKRPSAAKPPRQAKAVTALLPDMLPAQLATLVDAAPTDEGWEYELKLDGYRVLARIEDGKAVLYTRDGKDWTARLPVQVKALEQLQLKNAWLDGEIVMMDAQGIPSFQQLQNAFRDGADARIQYFLFDLPFLDGQDLRALPLTERRTRLEKLLEDQGEDGPLRYSAPLQESPQRLLESACRLHMEGIMGKRSDSPYTGKRSADWIKLKCQRRQEFVIAGYTEPKGIRTFLGALLLAVNDEDGKLRYAGKVGTGFDKKNLEAVFRQLKPLTRKTAPFAKVPGGLGEKVHWVKPELVAEVSFAEWTQDGLLRHAVFQGLRQDKPAAEIRRERAVAPPSPAQAAAKPDATAKPPRSSKDATASAGEVKITHPDRVIDPASGFTKLDVARYYVRVAQAILPYLRNRPVYLLRTPEGIEGEKFFQKHSNFLAIPGIGRLDRALDPGHEALLTIPSVQALAGVAQMGAVELHTVNATADRFDKPDSMVFDLDPDPDLPWKEVAQAARLIRVLLEELGLPCFLKTSGGKGLHIAVPLAQKNDWDEVGDFAQALAQHLAKTLPRQFSAKMGEQNRVGKIYVDYQRNRKMASTVAPYSVRARPGLPVSVPIAWEELDGIGSAAKWSIASLPERLAALEKDPWKDYFASAAELTPGMRDKLA